MLTAVVGISARYSKFAFVLFCYITNHLMTGPLGNSEFCFPRIFVSGNIEILGKQNSLFPKGPVIKCLMLNPAIFISSYRSGHLAEDMIRFIQSKSFLHLNTDIFMTPVIDLSSSNFERIIKDRARNMMVMYYNGNCDLCNSLQSTIHDVGITFRNEPNCLIGRLNCDAEPKICIEQTIPHYPTFKVYSKHNKDGVVYEPGPHQESYSERNMTTFMNALCGTQREIRGRLNEKVSLHNLQIAH